MANILIIVPVIAQEGVSSMVIPQINELVRRNFSVCLVVLSRILLENHKINLPRNKIYELGSNESFLSIQALFTSSLLVGHLRKIIQKEQANYVFAHAPYGHFIARLAKLTVSPLARFKLIQYFHSPQYLQFPNNTLQRKAFNAFMAKLAKKLDDIHVSVSSEVKSDIEANLIKVKEHYVIFNTLSPQSLENIGVGTSSYHEWFKDNCFKILLPGRLDYNKGQLFFIDVFEQFTRLGQLQKEQVKLLIVGEGIIKQELINKVQGYNLVEQVELTGGVPHEVLMGLMKQADLVVVPSMLEGMPLVILEALHMKKLILASDTGGSSEAISNGKTGFLFKKMDKEDCLQKLSFIFKNRNLKLLDEEKVEHDLMTKFSFEGHINQLLNLLNAS